MQHLKKIQNICSCYRILNCFSKPIFYLSLKNGQIYNMLTLFGHGLQQAPGVGRYLSELILNLPPKLDLSRFGAERILENRPLSETGLV